MSKIIKAMKLLGYSPNDDGVCFGIAMMSAQAIIREQSQTFINRISFINNATEEEIKSLTEPFDIKVKNYLHEKKLDLCCFFDELSIYQGKESVNKEFKSIVPNQSVDNVKDLANAAKNNQYSYPIIKKSIINLFTYSEFFDLVMKIKNHLAGHSFSVLLSHSPHDHATQIGFNGKQKRWISSDHDYVVDGDDNFSDIRKVIDNIFTSHKFQYANTYRLVASLDILLPEKDDTQPEIDLSVLENNNFNLETLTSAFNKQALSHVIASYEYASRYDEMIAIFDKIKSLNLPEQENIQLLESTRATGLTLFHYLTEKDEADTLAALFKKAEEMQLSLNAKIRLLEQKKNHSPSALLILALKYKSLKVVQVLIDVINGIDNELIRSRLLGGINSEGFSPLLSAAYDGDTKVIPMLIKSILSIKNDQLRAKLLEARNIDGVSALFVAATMGDKEIAQALISAISSIKDYRLRAKLLEANLGNVPSVLSALLVATQKGHREIVQSLLGAICDIKDEQLRATLLGMKDSDGFSALWIAAADGNKEMAEVIVSAIYSIKDEVLRTKLLAAKNNNNLSALMIAKRNGHKAVIKILTDPIYHHFH